MTHSTPGARVRQLRQARGLTIEVLAVMAGLSVRWVSMIENDQGRLRPRVAAALAGALGVSVQALLSGDGLGTLLGGEA